ncbi:hypothetical protein Pcinc_039043 [Petrolisthes cinctipes]|uniref:Uncharacterized protein n=1 Tax=Petrolisthes cinctipes TaxID=88211 RepID=A0AAE1BSG9_PETCI|nr:hypothetical protein Pcinc_039043 [Petrolisthes cinctipes]
MTEGREPVDVDVDLAGVIGASSVETLSIRAGGEGLGNCGHSVVHMVQRLVDTSLGDMVGDDDDCGWLYYLATLGTSTTRKEEWIPLYGNVQSDCHLSRPLAGRI